MTNVHLGLGGGSCMEILYVNNGLKTYLDVEVGLRKDLYEKGLFYKVKMLESNSIPHIIAAHTNEIDGNVYLRFHANCKSGLSALMEKIKPDGKILKLVFEQILSCIKCLGEYLLDPSDLVLDPNYMFLDYNDKKLEMIYLPGYGKNIVSQLKSLLEYMMRIFDHRDKQGVFYLYDLYDRVTDDDFLIEEYDVEKDKPFIDMDEGLCDSLLIDCTNDVDCETSLNKTCETKNIVTAWDKNRVEKISGQNFRTNDYSDVENCDFFDKENTVDKNKTRRKIVITGFICAFLCLIKYVFLGKEIVWLWIFVGLVSACGIGSIAMFDVIKDEEQIDEDMKKYIDNEFKLIPVDDDKLEEIVLSDETEIMTVGRGKTETDYRLENAKVSRIHAHVMKENNQLFLRDDDSTNGTFVNGKRISGHEKRKLKKGDVVSFANEKFYVS